MKEMYDTPVVDFVKVVAEDVIMTSSFVDSGNDGLTNENGEDE